MYIQIETTQTDCNRHQWNNSHTLQLLKFELPFHASVSLMIKGIELFRNLGIDNLNFIDKCNRLIWKILLITIQYGMKNYFIRSLSFVIYWLILQCDSTTSKMCVKQNEGNSFYDHWAITTLKIWEITLTKRIKSLMNSEVVFELESAHQRYCNIFMCLNRPFFYSDEKNELYI